MVSLGGLTPRRIELSEHSSKKGSPTSTTRTMSNTERQLLVNRHMVSTG
jgi:hypothetical protein